MSTPRRIQTMPISTRRRTAFTLLEMVIACMLLAVLLAVVARVMRSILIETKLNESPDLAVSELLAEQFRRDLLNAHSYRQLDAQHLQLLGFVAQEPATGQSLLTSAMATYRIKPTSGGSLLVREQLAMPSTNTAASIEPQSQPLCIGAVSLRLDSDIVERGELTENTLQAPLRPGGNWFELAPVVELTIAGPQGQVLFREMIVREAT